MLQLATEMTENKSQLEKILADCGLQKKVIAEHLGYSPQKLDYALQRGLTEEERVEVNRAIVEVFRRALDWFTLDLDTQREKFRS